MHIAKQSARGSVTLFGGNLAATLISALTSVLVARFLGPAGFGAYSLALVAPGFIQIFSDLGTRPAVTRFVALHLSKGEGENARRYAQSSILFAVLTGAVLTVVSFLGSGWVASTLLQRPSLQPYIAIASVGVIGQSVLQVGLSVATGRNSMVRASLLNVSQAAFKLVTSISLIVIGLGVAGAVVGHATSYVFAGVIAAVLYVTGARATSESLNEAVADAKEMIRFGFQPFVGTVLVAVSSFYVSLLLAATAGNSVVGSYQAAANLIVPATLLASSTATALYPAFSRLHGLEADTASAFRLSVKYVSYLIIPVLFLISATAPELMRIVYGGSYSGGAQYLALLPVAYTPIIIGMSVVPGFFNAVGRPRFVMYATGLGAVGLLVAAPLLAITAGLGVVGLIYALFVSNLVAGVVGLFLIRKNRLGNIDSRPAVAVLVASGASLGVCLLLPGLGPSLLGAGAGFVLKLVVFAAIYLVLAPLLGAIDEEDVDRIYESLREVAFLGTLLGPFARVEREIASWAHAGRL